MPITNFSDFKIYNEEFQGGAVETLNQNAEAFNAASGGCIRLLTDSWLGKYKKETFFQSLGAGLVGRQDVASNAAQTPLKLTQGEMVDVKLFRKMVPVKVTQNSFDEIGGDADQDASFIIGKQFGVTMSLEMLNTALAAARAAITGVSANVKDVTGDTVKTISHSNILKAMALYGDQSSRIKAYVMHSQQWFDLMQQGLTDGFEEISTGIITSYRVPSFSRPIIVTDSPSLIATADTPDSYFVLGLVEGAVQMSKFNNMRMDSDKVLGNEQLELIFQGEYKYSLGVKGFAWDITSGGDNPNDSALATAGNWDSVMTSPRALAGVVLKCQASS
jgi:hypothetical protein